MRSLADKIEGVILKLSEVSNENSTLRIDSEFFKNEYLKNIETIKKYSNGFNYLYTYIKEITGGATPLGAVYYEKGIKFLRVQNIMQNYFNLNDIVFISDKDDKDLKRSRLKLNDVLLTITGVSYGKSAVVNKDLVNANINQHSVRLELNEALNPFFLSTFLNSKFGKLQSDKNIVGVTRPALDYKAIKNFCIPNVSMDVQKEIENIVCMAFTATKQSEILYKRVEELLLNELGLKNWQPSNENTAKKTLRESFLKTGRIDAEFYMPFFEEVENILKGKYGFVTIQDICSDINYGTVPTSPYTSDGTGIPYIKGTNFKNTIIENEGLDKLVNTQDLVSKYFTKEGDIIISQMGTVGDTGVVTKEQVGWLFASFTIRIRIKDKKQFNPYFIAFYIQHIAKPYYLYRYIAQASVRQNTDLPTIRNMYIPKVSPSIQNEIASLIQQSFKLRSDSSHLLEIAKHAIEIAIEKDEKEAMNYIKVNERF